MTRTRVDWSGFLPLEWLRLRLLLLVGAQWEVSEFSHNPSGRGFEPHPPHRLNDPQTGQCWITAAGHTIESLSSPTQPTCSINLPSRVEKHGRPQRRRWAGLGPD